MRNIKTSRSEILTQLREQIQVGVKQQSHTHSPNPHIQLDEQHCCNRTLRHNLELYTYIDVNQSTIR
jgi:hypothetical protein